MCFFVNGKQIENVDSYAHLGHIITSQFTDLEEIQQRWNAFVGQVNNLLFFLNWILLLD